MARMPKQPLITIIDDDESVRQALMGLMRALGFVSEGYPCAEDFLRSGRLRRTACLIADVRMPGMTGLAPDVQPDECPAILADPAAAPAEPALAFGPFHLLPRRRLLLKDAKPVRLGSRALEILIALIERPGELLSKGELMARVWPDTFVDEGNLKVQVAGLRRALGDSGGSNRYLATVPGRGYRFVAPITGLDEARLPAPRQAAVAARDLPAPMAPIIDRADSVEALTAQLPHQRFITVVGPGGIGKTTVALAAARRLAASYEHGVRFIDLAPLLDP